MKRIIALALVILTVLTLCACGQSENQKAFKSAVKAIPEEINYNSAPEIADAYKAYEALSDDEKAKVKTDDYDSAVDSFAELPAVQACAKLKSMMKDPDSFKLCGDVSWVSFSSDGSDTLYVACVLYDARNGFGAYSGAEMCEVAWADDGFIGAYRDGDRYYQDLYNTIIKNATDETDKLWAGNGFTYVVIPGAAVAAALGCEYTGE